MVIHIPQGKFIYCRLKKGDALYARHLESLGLIHKVDGHSDEKFLRQDLKKRHGITDYRDVYLFPMVKPGASVTRFHGRAFYYTEESGEVHQFKGIGATAHPEGIFLHVIRLQTPVYLDKRKSYVPIGQIRNRDIHYGQLKEHQFDDAVRGRNALVAAWSKFTTKEPALAKKLNAPREAPFSEPKLLFEPLELIAEYEKEGELRKRLTRVSMAKAVEYDNHTFEGTVMAVINGKVTPERFWDFPTERLSTDTRRKFVEKIAVHYEVNLSEKGAAAKLHLLVMNRALSVLYAARKHGNLALHIARQIDEDALRANLTRVSFVNVFLHPKDFNGVIFYDTDELSKATEYNLPIDVNLLASLSRTVAKVIEPNKKMRESLTRAFFKRKATVETLKLLGAKNETIQEALSA